MPGTSSFPGIADALADNKAENTLTSGDHAPHHNALADGIMAIQQALLGVVDSNLQTKTPSGDAWLITNRIVGQDAVGIRLRATSSTSSIGLLLDNSSVNSSLAGMRLAVDNSLQFVTGGVSGGTLATALARWGVTSAGHLLAVTDNVYDIGTATGSRPRNVYTSGALQIYDPNAGLANDGTNYENVQLGWVGTSPGLRYFAGGTGSAARTLRITGGGGVLLGDTGTDRFLFGPSGFTFSVDNTYDIGASGASRPRNIYQAGGTFLSYNPGSGIANDATNYERGGLLWSANQLQLRVDSGGTGVARSLLIYTHEAQEVQFGTNNVVNWRIAGGAGGHLWAAADNAFDIGQSAANRPRNVYVAGNVTSGGMFTESAQDGVVAHAGGGQTSATLITTQTTRVATVATIGDSIKLPTSAPGLELILINHGANAMQVYGSGTDTIDDIASATGVSHMANSIVIYVCATAGSWYTEGLANGFAGGLQTMSYANGITAFAGGGQTNATLLTAMINRVTTVATAADSVKLPTAAAGLQLTVTNAAATNSMNLFPNTGDTINNLGANAAFALPASKTAQLTSAVAGQWHSVLSA